MMQIRQIVRIVLFIAAAVGLAVSCSTQKNTATTRAFHNLTARYNYYFNANEIYQNATSRAAEEMNYNYAQPLPVLVVGQSHVHGMVQGDMERAIEKCTNLITHHSITVKPDRPRGSIWERDPEFYNQNEYVRWARRAWLLIGKSRVWMGAYSEASQTFEHIMLQFPNTELWHEAQVWMARIEIFNDDYLAAADRLRIISNNRNYPDSKYFTHLLESTWAEFHVRQRSFSEALPHLYKALDNAPDKKHRVRYTYLLAQINHDQGNYAEAYSLYRRVDRMSPPYEMRFNARVNMAATSIEDGRGTDMKRQLLKMADDEKNQDYLDQLYYTLATIEQSEGNMAKAIEYYQLSAQSSKFNNIQKGISYLALADYFFEKPNYQVSQAYYDSAYNALDISYPGFRELEVKALNLNKLVESLNVIEQQDSLLRVADMPSGERDALIASLIRQVREEEQRLRQEEQDQRAQFAQHQQQRGRQDQTQGGKWYFYNQSALSFGQSEFRSRWGDRRLEDNWRRSNRREIVTDFGSLASEDEEVVEDDEKVIDNKSREFYLQHLPLNDSLKEIAHANVIDAMLRVGEVYQNDLNDYKEAIRTYEQLVERYPNSQYTIQAYYNLYQINRFIENESRANQYKQTIISKYPDSYYAQMLSNPNFLAEMRAKERSEQEAYEATYSLFEDQNYADVIQRANHAIEENPEGELAPRYKLLAALSTAQTSGVAAYRQSLNQLIELYPDTESASRATDIISFLDRRELQLAAAEPERDQTQDQVATVSPSDIYQEPDGEHLFIALVPKQAPLNQLRFNVVSLNVDYFIDMNLNVANQELNQYIEIITVEPLPDKEMAMEYYNRANAEEGLMGSLSASEYNFVVISKENFDILLRQRSAAAYINFFRTNY